MKILCSVFSYNRYSYLKNFVDSWQEFFGHGDLLVVDDGSDNVELINYLEVIEHEPKITVVRVTKKKVDGFMHGGLYHNMDLACDYAYKFGYDYLYFAQDDTQFVLHDPLFLERVHDCFSNLSDICIVKNTFFKQIWIDSGKLSVWRISDKTHGYFLRNASMMDLGVIKPSMIKQFDFRFALGNESSNKNWWLSRGYRSVRIATPSCDQVPEPSVYRNGKQYRASHSKPNKYYIKPLSHLEIDQLTRLSGDVESAPIMEDWFKTWSWCAEKPYSHRTDDVYFKASFKKKYKPGAQTMINILHKVIPAGIRLRLALLLKD